MSYLHQRVLLRDLFDAAVRAADPAHCLPPSLPPDPPQGAHPGGRRRQGRRRHGAGGRGALARRGPLDGSGGDALWPRPALPRIEVVEAAHPVPDAAGLRSRRAPPRRCWRTDADDLVLVLLSGGGSALLAAALGGRHAGRQAAGQPRC
jgi:glycerate 2-kinase